MANWYADGNAEVGIWAQRSAGWQLVTTQPHYVSGGPYSSGGTYSFTANSGDLTVNLGSNVLAVGITIEMFNAASAGINSFTKLAWQAQGSAGGTRSATPNGEKTTVVVTP